MELKTFKKKEYLRDFWVAFSFVNLCLIRAWYPILIPAANFYQGRVPDYSDYAAVLFNMTWMTALLFFLMVKVKKFPRFIQYGFFFLLGLFLIYRSDQLVLPYVSTNTSLIISLWVLVLTVCILSKPVASFCIKAAYLLFSLPSFLWAYYIIAAPFYIHSTHAYLAASPQREYRQTHSNQNRLIWMVFDELDQNYVFDRTINKSSTPNLFKFYESSFHATRANAPTDQTVLSILSYLIGEKVNAIHIAGLKSIQLQTQKGEKKFELKNLHTVFNKVHENQFRIGIAGWHLPYCYLTQDISEVCSQFGSSKYNYFTSNSFLSSVKMQLRTFLPDWLSYEHLIIYQSFLSSAKSLVTNKDLNLIYLHFPIPHPPQIYDPNTGIERSFSSNPHGYDANLALAEKAFTEIQDILVKNGMWDNTMIILTSDHWKRVPREYFSGHSEVPFIVKLKEAENRPYSYPLPTNSMIAQDLLVPLLKGEIQSPQALADFLSHKPFPYPLESLITN